MNTFLRGCVYYYRETPESVMLSHLYRIRIKSWFHQGYPEAQALFMLILQLTFENENSNGHIERIFGELSLLPL